MNKNCLATIVYEKALERAHSQMLRTAAPSLEQ